MVDLGTVLVSIVFISLRFYVTLNVQHLTVGLAIANYRIELHFVEHLVGSIGIQHHVLLIFCMVRTTTIGDNRQLEPCIPTAMHYQPLLLMNCSGVDP